MLDYKDMPIEHIVVDGSNIATEGRSLPSLKQLEEAVAELRRDHPTAEITVIVDATFAHRIDPSELPRFEQAALRNEYVHPPAGAIGRGDAFLLRVAEKVDATVLSNDSFQEFHGEHPWLFERGRLLGATPIPGIGWIFSPRQPVRGPRSHQAVRETEMAKKRVTKAIAVATKEVVKPSGKAPGTPASADGSRRRGRGAGTGPTKTPVGARERDKPTPLAVNDPLAFISFIAEHRLGEQLEGEVEGYTSHGAVVRVGEMRCYIPLANLGDPAPRSAREVLKRGERGEFVLTALDPQRRGAELALPGIAHVSGHPREETVAAEVRLAKPPRKRAGGSGAQEVEPAKRPTTKKSPPEKATTTSAPPERPVRATAASSKQPAKKVVPRSGAPSLKAVPGKKAPTKAASTRAAAGRAGAEKVPATKSPSRRTGTTKASVDPVRSKQPAKKASAKKAPATKGGAVKTAAKKAAAAQAPSRTATARVSPAKKASRGTTAAKRPAPRLAAKTTSPAVADREPPATTKGRRSPRAAASTR